MPQDIIIPQTTTPKELLQTFNLQSVNAYNGFRPNPYVIAGLVGDNVPDKTLYLSTLGTPVYTDLTFERITYGTSNNQTKVVPEIRLQTILITVSLTKNIIETAIQGKDGTVPEYIGAGDYQITINGIICGANGHYPKDEVAQLKKMFDAPRSIPVISWYLQNLDIYDIIVKDYAFDQEPGGYSKQNFTVNCRSYFPVELLIS